MIARVTLRTKIHWYTYIRKFVRVLAGNLVTVGVKLCWLDVSLKIVDDILNP